MVFSVNQSSLSFFFVIYLGFKCDTLYFRGPRPSRLLESSAKGEHKVECAGQRFKQTVVGMIANGFVHPHASAGSDVGTLTKSLGRKKNYRARPQACS